MVCIPMRLSIVYVTKKYNNKYFALIALMASFSWMYLFITDTRKMGGFGNKAWWNFMRPVHSQTYLLYAIYTMTGYKNAWIVLMADLIMGIIVFTKKRIL